jgi:hypothetical protein
MHILHGAGVGLGLSGFVLFIAMSFLLTSLGLHGTYQKWMFQKLIKLKVQDGKLHGHLSKISI